MSALVRIEKDDLVTDSQVVAAEFGKRHRDVLRSITALLNTSPEHARNFARMFQQVKIGQGGVRNDTLIVMDEKGFLLLVFGFTGAKALAIKSRFIDEFQRMRALLTAAQPAVNDDEDDLPALTSAGVADYLPALAVIREARQVFGRGAAQRLWGKLGLPDVFDHPAEPRNAGLYHVPATVRDWMEQRTAVDMAVSTPASALYASYLSWCDAARAGAETQTRFGMALQSMGFTRASGRDGRVIRRGLKLLS